MECMLRLLFNIFWSAILFTSILFIVFGIYSSAFFVNRDWESIAFIVLFIVIVDI